MKNHTCNCTYYNIIVIRNYFISFEINSSAKSLTLTGFIFLKNTPMNFNNGTILANVSLRPFPYTRVNGKWRTHIIFELCKHTSLRFGELKKSIPAITNSMLTSTLRDLEKLGIIYREQFNEIPPHVEYSLTKKGKALIPVFIEISKWGEVNLD